MTAWQLVAALESVSLATWFEEDTPLELILGCRPDVLVKGGDWPIDKNCGWQGSGRLGRQGRFHPVPIRTFHHIADLPHPQTLTSIFPEGSLHACQTEFRA